MSVTKHPSDFNVMVETIPGSCASRAGFVFTNGMSRLSCSTHGAVTIIKWTMPWSLGLVSAFTDLYAYSVPKYGKTRGKTHPRRLGISRRKGKISRKGKARKAVEAIFQPNSCQCSNGSPMTGSSCTSNGANKCASCNSGYHLDGSSCTGLQASM